MKIEKQSFFSRLFNKDKKTQEQKNVGSCSSSGTMPFITLDSAASNYGVATINKAKQQETGEGKLSKEQVEAELKAFLNNDEYEIYCHQEFFSSLDKYDYENMQVHLENIKCVILGKTNFARDIIDNGYFSSKDGAVAFSLLASIFDKTSKNNVTSLLNQSLEKYNVKEVLTLHNRNLLSPSILKVPERYKKIANMDEGSYSSYSKHNSEKIKSTGENLGQLHKKLSAKLSTLMDDNSLKRFSQKNSQSETVVQQLDLLDFLESYPVKIKNSELSSILSLVDVDNLDVFKNLLEQLKSRPDASASNITSLLRLLNEDTEQSISELIKIEDVPLNKIVEVCYENPDFAVGAVSNEQIIQQINNDPFVQCIRTIKASNVELLPSDIKPKSLNQYDIEPEALALVHMTSYYPEGSVISTPRDKTNGTRNTIHFTLNHPVHAHRKGDWDKKEYAIIMPYPSAVIENNEGKFIEGMPNDIYTNGSVSVPEGTVIVKFNPQMKDGEINISESNDIVGTKIIESSLYPHQLVPTVLEKMGYSHLESELRMGMFELPKDKYGTIEEKVDNFNAWKKFCQTQHIKPMNHTCSPSAIAEATIENVAGLCAKNVWNDNGNKKAVLLKSIDLAIRAEKKGYSSFCDLEKLREIIKTSKTPQQAHIRIKEDLKIEPTLKEEMKTGFWIDLTPELYAEFYDVVSSESALKKYLQES